MSNSSRPVKIGRFNPETETWQVLASFTSYINADLALDGYWERFPNAWIEILDGSLTGPTD